MASGGAEAHNQFGCSLLFPWATGALRKNAGRGHLPTSWNRGRLRFSFSTAGMIMIPYITSSDKDNRGKERFGTEKVTAFLWPDRRPHVEPWRKTVIPDRMAKANTITAESSFRETKSHAAWPGQRLNPLQRMGRG